MPRPRGAHLRALVTGGSGYFGCVLRDRLLERGVAVRIFDLVDADERPPNVEFVQGDIRDRAAVRAACDGVDVVYHNVAQVPLAKDRHLFRSVNRDGTATLLVAARDSRVGKVVHTSSSAVFGAPPRNPVDDTIVPRPHEAYGRAKLEAEAVVASFVREYAMDVTVIRPRTILGHGRLGIFQILFSWIEEGRSIPVLGRGDNLYQFVHADDVASAVIAAAVRPGPATYNVGAERFATMRESLEALCAHAGTGSRVRPLPMALAVAAMRITSCVGLSPLAPYHALMYGRSFYFDISRAQRELGWQPAWSNVEMLCDSYDWYRAHKSTLGIRHATSPHRGGPRQRVLGLVKHLF